MIGNWLWQPSRNVSQDRREWGLGSCDWPLCGFGLVLSILYYSLEALFQTGLEKLLSYVLGFEQQFFEWNDSRGFSPEPLTQVVKWKLESQAIEPTGSMEAVTIHLEAVSTSAGKWLICRLGEGDLAAFLDFWSLQWDLFFQGVWTGSQSFILETSDNCAGWYFV